MTLTYDEKVFALKTLKDKLGSKWTNIKTGELFTFTDLFSNRVTIKDVIGYATTMDAHYFVDEYKFHSNSEKVCNQSKILKKYGLGDEVADKLKSLAHLTDADFEIVCKNTSELLSRQIESCVEAYQSYFLETDEEENQEITEAIINSELL